jgi:proton glutamate symport protein
MADTPPPRTRLKPWRWSLHWQIALALVLGVGCGLVWGKNQLWFGFLAPTSVYAFLGDLFLRSLRMVIVPLLAGSIITGVTGVGSARSLGRLFRRTFGWYIATSLLAILTGLLLVNLIRPGHEDGVPVGPRLGLDAATPELREELQDRGAGDLVGIVLRMIPENPMEAASTGQMLPLIFFSLLYGIALTLLPERHREAQVPFWNALFAVMMRITGWVIRLTPVGVLGLIAGIVAESGFEAFAPLARYASTVLLALVIHACVTLPLLVALIGRLRPHRHARAMAPALLTAFSTRSSSATLPLTLDRVRHGAGVSNRVASFVLPLGATVNMDGTALYECVAVVFIAQVYGFDLTFGAQLLIVLTALLASIGAASVPMAGLVMMTIILSAVGLPLEAVGLIIAVDRFLDMFRTATNVLSDSVGTVIVAKLQGEDVLRKGPAPTTPAPTRYA